MHMVRRLLYGLIAAAVAAVVISVVALQETQDRIDSLTAQSRLVETRHGVLEYISWGRGNPVLVVHGAGGGFDQGRLLANAVGGERFQWIAVSRFGYLRSALPDQASTAAQAEDFVDLLDALAIERVDILAMSGGVPPTLKFAEMYPERTNRLVLLSSAPFTPYGSDVDDRPVPSSVYSLLLGNDVVYWILTKIARDELAAVFDARAELRVDLPPADAVFVDDLIDSFLPASQRLAGIQNEGAAVDPRTRYDLEAITAAVLVVHARDDRINPFEIGEEIARRIDHAEFLALDRGGHLLLGHHQRLRRQLSRFLAD